MPDHDLDYLTRHAADPLSREEEHALFVRWKEHGDARAQDKLARSYLRYAVQLVTRARRRGGASVQQLVPEATWAIAYQMTKFDPHMGTRFVTYLKPLLVRLLDTAHKLELFPLSGMSRQTSRAYQLKELAAQVQQATTEAEVNALYRAHAVQFKASVTNVREATRILAHGRLTSLDEPRPGRLEFDHKDLHEWIADPTSPDPLAQNDDAEVRQAIDAALDQLPGRTQHLIRRHLLDGEELSALARDFHISRERARQIVVGGLRRLAPALTVHVAGDVRRPRVGNQMSYRTRVPTIKRGRIPTAEGAR